MHISHRRRRHLALLVGLAVVATPLIYLAVHYSTSGNPGNPHGPVVPDYAQPKRSPFTAAERRAVRPVLKRFIGSAVARHDVARAWDVTGPSLRQGITRKEWDKGNIPVVPYPAANRGLGTWSYVEYSYTNAVGLEVFVFPKPGSGWSAMTADVELVKGRDGQWRVDYWLPKKFHGPPSLAKQAKQTTKNAQATRRRAAPEPAAAQPARASRGWWAIPIGVLSLILLVPATIVLVYWRQGRKAEREYLRSMRDAR
jgi:hypothetical protein